MTAFHLTAPLWFVLDALAVGRLTRLVTKDTITARFRTWVLGRGWTRTFDFLTCGWCTSVWLAVVVVALTVKVPREWQYAAYVLACSAIAAMLETRS